MVNFEKLKVVIFDFDDTLAIHSDHALVENEQISVCSKGVWLGEFYDGTYDPYYIDEMGDSNRYERQDTKMVIAPAFILDPSKVKVKNHQIIIKGTADTNEVNDANEVTDAIEVTDSIEVTDTISKLTAF